MRILSLLAISAVIGGNMPAEEPYKNAALPVEQRVADLTGRMTLEEKVAQLQTCRGDDPQAWDEQGNFVGGSDAPKLVHGAGAYFNLPAFAKSGFNLPPRVWATLDAERLSALGMDMNPVVQPGDFETMAGRSSVDCLKSTLSVR